MGRGRRNPRESGDEQQTKYPENGEEEITTRWRCPSPAPAAVFAPGLCLNSVPGGTKLGFLVRLSVYTLQVSDLRGFLVPIKCGNLLHPCRVFAATSPLFSEHHGNICFVFQPCFV